MYITITPQKIMTGISQSVTSFAEYLEKENIGKPLEEREPFFNQYSDRISRFTVIKDIDTNTRKLKKKEPKFYSITVNPSFLELKAIENNRELLQQYTRKVMEDYVDSFHKSEIHGRKFTVDDIVYYAKIEHERSYGFKEKYVQENIPYIKKLEEIQARANAISSGKIKGDIELLKKEYHKVYMQVPHKQQGEIIVKGMKKEGHQSHIHIIVSRKDRSNSISLSPSSSYKKSTANLNKKQVKRGFDRDLFRQKAEERFDKMFHLQRNYVVSYKGRKDLVANPTRFISRLMKLPTNERAVAIRFLMQNKVPGISALGALNSLKNIPTTPVGVFQKGIDLLVKIGKKGIEASSIGI